MTALFQYLPPEAGKIILVLLLSFLIGLEREERKNETDYFTVFGGVRAYPIIGLMGYAFAKLSGEQLLPLAIGFATLGLFFSLSYWKKLSRSDLAGLTSELMGLFTYLMGAMVFHEFFWVSVTLVVLGVLLLELKNGLEGIAKKIHPAEIFTLTKFLILSAVILPALPNESFTQFNLNPFKTWLVVVVISGISYLVYLMDQWKGKKGSTLISAILGGAYSSTLYTLLIAKRTQNENMPRQHSGSILIACGMMYFRLIAFLFILSLEVAKKLALTFIPLGIIAILFGLYWMKTEKQTDEITAEQYVKNPLEIKSALLFASLFVFMGIITHLAQQYLGSSGIYSISFLSGLSDVDPFIMSISQSKSELISINIIATAIAIATQSNNLLKGIYAYSFGKGPFKMQTILFLMVLCVLGFSTFLI